jgi:hypothetical protein
MIIAFWILGTTYQSIVTTFMMEPMQTSTLKTIDELFMSDYKVYIFDLFDFAMKENVAYQKAISGGRIRFMFEHKVVDDHAYVSLCSLVHGLLNFKFIHLKNTSYYLLPERQFMTPLNLDVGFLNPFLNKLQHLMDLCFTAGLPRAWKTFHQLTMREWLRKNGQTADIVDESNDILDLSQILPICVILLIGHGFALMAFLLEVFYHDCVRHCGFVWRRLRKGIERILRRLRPS